MQKPTLMDSLILGDGVGFASIVYMLKELPMHRDMDRPLSEQGSLWFVASATLTAALGGFLFGFDTAVISGTVDFVKKQFELSVHLEGWFVSSAILGCILGVMVAGKLSDALGRKKILLLSALLFLVSAIGCAVAPTATILILSRLMGGWGIGIASMLAPLYISEFTPPNLRGRMVAIYQFAITIGIVCAYLSNKLLLDLSQSAGATGSDALYRWMVIDEVWRGMFAVAAAPALVFGLLLLVIPESPRWLVKQKRADEALQILARIGGRRVAEAERSQIEEAIALEEGGLGQLLRPGWRTALLIGILLPFFSQVSGINAVIYYGPKILAEAGFARSEAFGGQVIIGLVNILFTVVAIATIDRFGRRPLLMLGISGVVVALIVIGILFANGITQGYWLLVFIILFTACFAFSFGPVCWVIISEIYPTGIRGRAMSLATFSLWVGCWLVAQGTPRLMEALQPAGTFWLFAALCFPAILLTWKIIPETKGKTLEEIEQYWNDRGGRG
jgi:MFS transporter, SP family, arabinose:H+ symporter